MNTYYGTWTPLDGAKPDVTDLDFAAYYILESGTLADDTTEYTAGQWLIYSCEARGTLSERQIWRTASSLAVFNADSHTNVPDAGFYTKVRLDNAGNIVSAGDIEYADLPSELTTQLDAISDSSLTTKIQNILSTVFKNETLNPVEFSYDDTTGKISAHLKIDEESIYINDFGQLCSTGGTSSDSGTSAATEEEIQALSKSITDLETKLAAATPVEGDGITVTPETGGSIIAAKVDGTSISFNSNGELCIDPDVLANYATGSDGGECANHTHTSDQITDFTDAVTEIISNYAIKDAIVTNLEDLVDGTTIIINSSGQLESIATAVQKHTHVMDDITDLNQDIANVWANKQYLHASSDEEKANFDKGYLMMSTLNIGEILTAFNEEFNTLSTAVQDLSDKAGHIEPVAPGYLDSATFTVDSSSNINAIDVDTGKETSVSPKLTIATSDIIYWNGSKLTAIIDGAESDSIELYAHDTITSFAVGTYGNFNLTYIGEAYPKIPIFQGYYEGFSFSYSRSDLSEGEHTVQFKMKKVGDTKEYLSDTYSFKTYTKVAPEVTVALSDDLSPDTSVSGIKCNSSDNLTTIATVTSKCYTSKYAPIYSAKVWTADMAEVAVEAASYVGGSVVYKPVTITVPDYFGKYTINAVAYSIEDEEVSASVKTANINIDLSTEEDYRAYVANDTGSIKTYAAWDSTFDLSKDPYLKECQVKDSMAIIGKTDYSSYGLGSNYSVKPATQEITLVFTCPLITNFYFDLYDIDGNAFSLDRNGCLEGVTIKANIVSSHSVDSWVDCNSPYVGSGKKLDLADFNGLDLYRSTATHRVVTFGKGFTYTSGNLYLNIKFSKAFNLKKLISSIEECMNER